MTLDPGTLNDRINLQQRYEYEDPDTGFPTIGYRDIATVWARYRPTGGREFREGSIQIGEERAVFTIQYREDISVVDRVIFDGKIWGIESVSRVGWKEALDLLCTSTGPVS